VPLTSECLNRPRKTPYSFLTLDDPCNGATSNFRDILAAYAPPFLPHLHRLLKIRTDAGHAPVHRFGSIGIFSIFSVTELSNVVYLLQNFVHIVSQTTRTILLLYDAYFLVCAYSVVKPHVGIFSILLQLCQTWSVCCR